MIVIYKQNGVDNLTEKRMKRRLVQLEKTFLLWIIKVAVCTESRAVSLFLLPKSPPLLGKFDKVEGIIKFGSQMPHPYIS